MDRTRAERRSAMAAIAVIIVMAAASTVDAQLPQPRLTSLTRTGMRAGEVVDVTLHGTDLEGVSRLWFDHPGIRATPVKDLTFRVIAAPDVPLGQHDVRALGTYGLTNPRTFVIGDRPESMEAEANNSPDKANPIAINTVVNGALAGATDVDCFAIEGKRGQRLFLDVQAERIDSRLDATIRLFTPAGVELAESRDVFGSDPFLDVTLPDDGRYVIKVHDAIYSGSPDHVYRLTVHDGPHLDAILPLAAAPGPGATGSFTVIGRGLGRVASPDPQLKDEGRLLERLRIALPLSGAAGLMSNSSRLAHLFVPAPAAPREGFESSYVRISPDGAAPVVSNRVFIARAAAPVVLEQEPNDEDAQAQAVVPPCDLSGTFDHPGDVDRFRFPGRKGEVWWIEVFAERIGSPADPAFMIQKLGAKGQPAQDLAGGDDLPDAGLAARFNTQTIDAALRWQVPEDGLYQVLLNDLYGSQRGQPRLTYRLVIRREQPDFALFVVPENPKDLDAVTIRAGGRTAATVAVIRKDGFAGPIRVEARDLPPGLRVPPVTIGPGQILAPIVLEATEPAQTTVEPITLVGSSRFADRKHDLSYIAGAVPLGPPLVHEVRAGGMTWPPYPNPMTTKPVIAPARLFRGFAVGVLGEPSPLTLSAEPASAVVPQGGRLTLNLAVTRRAGFEEAVVATTTDLPPNLPAATVTIPKNARTAALSLSVPKNVPRGIYTFLVRGTGAYPFSKDPKAKPKPNVSLTEPSNPITITVR